MTIYGAIITTLHGTANETKSVLFRFYIVVIYNFELLDPDFLILLYVVITKLIYEYFGTVLLSKKTKILATILLTPLGIYHFSNLK